MLHVLIIWLKGNYVPLEFEFDSFEDAAAVKGRLVSFWDTGHLNAILTFNGIGSEASIRVNEISAAAIRKEGTK